jgi:hypothetical protein
LSRRINLSRYGRIVKLEGLKSALWSATTSPSYSRQSRFGVAEVAQAFDLA